jgi:hypothetical protein
MEHPGKLFLFLVFLAALCVFYAVYFVIIAFV